MVWRNHGSGAFSEDNCSDHLNKTFDSSEKSHRAFFYLLVYKNSIHYIKQRTTLVIYLYDMLLCPVMMMMVVKIVVMMVVMIILIMMTSRLIIHLSDMFLWPLAQKNALGPSSSLGSKLQNQYQS